MVPVEEQFVLEDQSSVGGLILDRPTHGTTESKLCMEELLSFYITCMSMIHNIIATGLQMQKSRACYTIQRNYLNKLVLKYFDSDIQMNSLKPYKKCC